MESSLLDLDPLGFETFPYDFQHVGGSCYVFTDPNGLSNVGVIDTVDGLVLVDSTLHPYYSSRLVKHLDLIFSKPILYLINTHFHRDHTGGNSEIKPKLETIAHKKTIEYLKDIGDKHFLEGGSIYLDVKICIPTVVFENNLTLDTNPKIEIQHTGGHTHDSIIVYVPNDCVLFTGDIFFNRFSPYLSFWSCADGYGSLLMWMRAIEYVLALGSRHIVPGHGLPGTSSELIDLQMFFCRYEDYVSEKINQGLSLIQIWQMIIKEKLFTRRDFDPDTYLYLVICLYSEIVQCYKQT